MMRRTKLVKIAGAKVDTQLSQVGREVGPTAKMFSIGAKIDANNGLAPGFDIVRVVLAVAVVAWHSVPIASRDTAWFDDARVAWVPGYAILAVFFGLSGFLITGSAQRLSLGNFLLNRGLRIFPALIVETALSAIILGTIFTTLSLSEYFSHHQTWEYFTSLFGYIKYYLPGVFNDNPIPQVNLSLWTVPYELLCYFIMSVFIIFGALKRPWLVVLAAAIFAFVSIALWIIGIQQESSLFIERGAYAVFVGRASRLLICFLLGIAAYLFRYKIPYSKTLFLGCCVYLAGLSLLSPPDLESYPLLNVVIGPVAVYICVFLGASEIPTAALFRKGDYSYGIYLYGAPIQQAMRALVHSESALINFLVSMPAILIFAAFSWHLIEKPVLHMRRHFSFVARVRN
ncbi:acyltransferase family protein [Sphingobium subterraneum]|nr:acyltransferase [Sphingobium subterraneum]